MGGQTPQPRPMFPPQGQPGMMPPQPQPGMGQMQPPQMQPQVMPQQQHAPQMPQSGGIVPPNFGQQPGMGPRPDFGQPMGQPRPFQQQGQFGGGMGGQFGNGQWAQRFQQRNPEGAGRLGGLMGLRG